MARFQNQAPDEKGYAIPIGVPYEGALVAAAMALMTALAPMQTQASTRANDAMLLGFGGFLLFAVAKVSLISAGRWSTWGPTPMRLPFKTAYLVGYLLMAISAAGIVSIL